MQKRKGIRQNINARIAANRKRAAEAQILAARGGLEEAIRFDGCQKIDHGFYAKAKRLGERRIKREGNVATDLAALWGGPKQKVLGDHQAWLIGGIDAEFRWQRVIKHKNGIIR